MARLLVLTRTAAEWTEKNLVLGDGQVGNVKGNATKKKIGDGVTPWNSLPYVSFEKHLDESAVLDFPNITAAGSQELTVTVTGADVGDIVDVGAPAAIEAGLVWNGYVSAADTVKIRVTNVTALGVNPASATWRVSVKG